MPTTSSDASIERRLHGIRQGLLAGDEEELGSGGDEILQTLIDFGYQAEPREELDSMRDYSNYQ